MAYYSFVLTCGLSFGAGLLAFYIYRKFICHNYFKRRGVQGPNPHWLFGSLLDLWATKERHLLMEKWGKMYGNIFGYYEGSTPILVVSEPNAIENLCIKQFRAFPGRKPFPIFPKPEKYPETPVANVGSLSGEQWKRLRTIVNPGFSTGRLKSYLPLIVKSQQELLRLFEEMAASKVAFDISETFQYLALDVISEVAFGIELNSIKNRGANNPILPLFKRLHTTAADNLFVTKLVRTLPELAPILQSIFMSFRTRLFKSHTALAQISEKVMEQRLQDPSLRRNDLLQMLIDSMDDKTVANIAGDDLSSSSLKPLTKIEVLSQTMQFFNAGTSTSRFTMSFASYCLATNPDCQQKLYNEIIANFPPGNDNGTTALLDYDTIMKMSYLDWVVNETLRLYPVGLNAISRVVVEPTQINGIPIDEKAAIQVDMWSVHQNAELWGPVDTLKFHPERFSPDYPSTAGRPNCAYLGFGAGPRICLGMRLALFEAKLSIVNLIHRFQILPPEGGYQFERLPVHVAMGMNPHEGVWVRLVKRAA